jgi:hypothetical protein
VLEIIIDIFLSLITAVLHGPITNLKENYNLFSRMLNCSKNEFELVEDNAGKALDHAKEMGMERIENKIDSIQAKVLTSKTNENSRFYPPLTPLCYETQRTNILSGSSIWVSNHQTENASF